IVLLRQVGLPSRMAWSYFCRRLLREKGFPLVLLHKRQQSPDRFIKNTYEPIVPKGTSKVALVTWSGSIGFD
ncbi:MAG: hypothetical protein L7W40_13900, partial [Akkermansiaceae bacterium]|nr:hypothetical protein [Akkermansiaceae bacterium]